MLISAFITHKKAETFSDCQDRFSINPDTKSIALSDGMSQSIFQKYWAEILVNQYTAIPDWIPNLNSVRELSSIWKCKVLDIVKKQKDDGNVSAWRAERSLVEGKSAGATFLGVRFSGTNWECDVLGDSCLIIINDEKISNIISSQKESSFDSYPDYYDSNPLKEGKGKIITERGSLNLGDSLLLVSDPLSDFLSKLRAEGKESLYVTKLLGITTHEEFEETVEEFRKLGMHNDDTTLISVKQDGKDEFIIIGEDKIEFLIQEEKDSKYNKEISGSKELEESETIVANEHNLHNPIEDSLNLNENSSKNKSDLSKFDNDEFYKKLCNSIHESAKDWRLKSKKRKSLIHKLACEILQLIKDTYK